MSQRKFITGVIGKGKTTRNPEKKLTGNVFTFFKGAQARQVKTDDLSTDDIIIAVMGPTGSGKSSFINAITGLEKGVGHDLESCTNKISNVRLSIPEMAFGDLVFVDTPGFDDTNKKDVDILKMVADWLKSTYEKNIKLSGLLYFHRISDNRMAGTPLKNLRMFEELCGKNAFQNVILTTTMWDDVDQETGEEREGELKAIYWRAMLARNSTTSRFLRTPESAFNLIEPLIEAGNRKSSVLLQDELVDMRKNLPETAAGQELYSAMGQIVSQREDLLRRIRHEMRHSGGDKMALEPLQEEHQKLKKSLEETVKEMRKLRLPLGQRLSIMRDKFFSSTFEFLMSKIFKRSPPDRPHIEPTEPETAVRPPISAPVAIPFTTLSVVKTTVRDPTPPISTPVAIPFTRLRPLSVVETIVRYPTPPISAPIGTGTPSTALPLAAPETTVRDPTPPISALRPIPFTTTLSVVETTDRVPTPPIPAPVAIPFTTLSVVETTVRDPTTLISAPIAIPFTGLSVVGTTVRDPTPTISAPIAIPSTTPATSATPETAVHAYTQAQIRSGQETSKARAVGVSRIETIT